MDEPRVLRRSPTRWAHCLVARYAVATRHLAETGRRERWRLMREMCSDIVELRKGDHIAERLHIERERLILEKERSGKTDPRKGRRVNETTGTERRRARSEGATPVNAGTLFIDGDQPSAPGAVPSHFPTRRWQASSRSRLNGDDTADSPSGKPLAGGAPAPQILSASSSVHLPACLFPKCRRLSRFLDKFCSVRSVVDRQVSFLIGDSETRFPGTAL
jgi:hypothetical protein